jgi:hypothetical protein
MASWTVPVIHATGDVLAVSDWNGVANDLTFLYEAPYANYYNSVATAMAANTNTQVTLGGTTSSNYGFSVSSSNAITPLAGLYAVFFSLTYTPYSSADYALGYAYHNGSFVCQSNPQFLNATYPTTCVGSSIIVCAAGDTLGLWGIQESSVSIETEATSYNTFLSAYFVGST